MRNIILILFGVLLLAACSAPRYSYYFDHYDYNSGKKKTTESRLAFSDERLKSPLSIEEHSLIASTDPKIIVNETPAEHKTVPVMDQQELQKKFSSMTREEKKAFRKDLKSEVKSYFKSKKKADNGNSSEAVKVMDYNLKMAIIFGAVALTLSFFGGVNSVFWILSVVALVVGVVFFIKWLAEQ